MKIRPLFLFSVLFLMSGLMPQAGVGQTAVEVNITGLANNTLNTPHDVTVLNDDVIFIADENNGRVLRVPLDGSNATEVAITGVSPLGGAESVAVNETHLFIGEAQGRLLQVPLAGGDATEITLSFPPVPFVPTGITAADLVVAGPDLFISDRSQSRVISTPLAGGNGTVYAITGLANNTLNLPQGLAVTSTEIYVSDFHNDRIVIIPRAGGDASELSFTGLANNTLNGPTGLALGGGSEPELFIADGFNNRLILLELNSGDASEIDFSGLLPDPVLDFPRGLGITEGALFLVDSNKDRVLKLTGPDDTQGLKVTASSVIGNIGDTVSVDVKLNVPDSTSVGGLQASLKLINPHQGSIIAVEDTNQVPGFSVVVAHTDSVAHFIVYSAVGDSIGTNPSDSLICLATLKVIIQGTAGLGNHIDLDVFNVQAGDPKGSNLNIADEDGRIFIGIRGDTNIDGQINILDIITLINRIVTNTLPEPNTTEFVVSNAADSDDNINVADAIAIVNQILGFLQETFGKSIPAGPVAVNLGLPVVLSDGTQAIPVLMDGQALIAGVQAEFHFDPNLIEVGTPIRPEEMAGMNIDSEIKDGSLRVIIHSMHPNTRLPVNLSPILYVPVIPRQDGRAGITLSNAVLADWRAQIVPHQFGTVSQTVTRGLDTPGSFSLAAARPNPFNPSTTISYEVPQTSHIRLTVYNILGQEVIRLVDQVRSPGRYTATWNAMNVKGQSVASGVYMYRITSSTGFSQSKRMTLLK